MLRIVAAASAGSIHWSSSTCSAPDSSPERIFAMAARRDAPYFTDADRSGRQPEVVAFLRPHTQRRS